MNICSPMAQKLQVSLDLLVNKVLQSHSDTPQSVGLMWTSDQPEA